MTRMFTDGAEMGDALFFTSNATSATATTAQKRSGSYSYLHGGGTGTNTKSITDVSEFYFRMGIRFVEQNNAKFFGWYSGTTELGSIRTGAGGFLTAYVGTGTLVATASTTSLTNGTWYLLEVHVKIADSGGDIEVKIDGVSPLEIDYSGDTKPGTDTTANFVAFHGAGTNQNYYFDDLALNDTSGGSDNSWCGEGKVILLTPNANGDSSQYTGSDGNTTDNYLLVDDIPHDTDTTYVENAVSGEKDLYALSACGLSNVTILRAWAEARARDTVAEGGQIYLTVKTESTEYDSSAISLLTTYTKVNGTDHVVNPNTSSAWTTTQLDALQVGPKTV